MRQPRGGIPRRPRQYLATIGKIAYQAWWVPFLGVGPWKHRPYCAAGECGLCDVPYKGDVTMKMPTRPPAGESGGPLQEPSKLFLKLAAFNDWLTHPYWEGSVEEKGERSIWMVTGGTYTKLLLKLDLLQLKMMVQGRSVDEAFAAAELALKQAIPPWEFPPPPKQKGPKKAS